MVRKTEYIKRLLQRYIKDFTADREVFFIILKIFVDKQYYIPYSIDRKIALPDREACLCRNGKTQGGDHMAFKIESGLLDACALAILSKGDTYGYEITQEMKKAVSLSESTLYPVLRRLQKEKLCRTYDQPFQGRNRRYYSITDEGRSRLAELRQEWNSYKASIDSVLNKGE